MSRRMIGAVLLAMTIAGCSNEPSKGALECAGGSRLELSSTDVCVYRDPLLVETGFNCPAEAQYGSSYGDLVVCSPDEHLPDDFFDEVAEQFPDDVPTGDCMATVCNLGQVCSAGACGEPPGNNELVAAIEVSPTSLDFGEVSTTRPVTRSTTISNVGGATLELSDVRVDAPFTYEDATSITLEPGESVDISIVITNDGNQQEGEVRGELSMTTNDPANAEVTLALTANLLFEEALCGDIFEPNDNPAEASETTSGSEYNAVLCMDEEDWWGFEVTEVGDHTLSIEGPVALDGVVAELFTFVDMSVDLTPHGRALSGTTDSITATLAPGQYAWRLIAPPTPVAYALTLSTTAAMCQADPNESNDTMSTATRSIEDADVGSNYLFGSICTADVDWYVIQNAGAGPLDADLEVGRLIEVGLTSFWGVTPTLTLHGPSGPVAATSSTASAANWNFEQLVYEVDVAGQYHVEVAAPAGEVLQYRLGVIARADSSCVSDVYEPNDDATNAALLSPQPGELLQVTDLHICDGDEDWYAIDLAAGAMIGVDIYHSTTASFALELFKEGEGTARATDIEVPTSVDRVEYTVPAGDGGRYLVRVSNQIPGSSARHYLLDVVTL